MDTKKTLAVLTVIDGVKTVVEVRSIGASLWQIMSGKYIFYVLRSEEIIEWITNRKD
jgi:hypothetical protein